MGRALSRLLAEEGNDIFLLGIGQDDLRASENDVRQRSGGANGGVKVGSALCDLEQPDTFASALDAADAFLGQFDTVIVTAGLFGTQDRLEDDIEFTRRLLVVNYAHTVVFLEHARKRLVERGGGTMVAFSSVAGDRGRKPVVLYGSSKAGLSAYLEGVDHKFRAMGIQAITVKPGFVKTGMTEGLPVPPFAGTPEQVARDVLVAIKKGKPVLYTPFMWRWVMLVIRQLPRFIMRKIGF